jgi:hypothetical protein
MNPVYTKSKPDLGPNIRLDLFYFNKISGLRSGWLGGGPLNNINKEY